MFKFKKERRMNVYYPVVGDIFIHNKEEYHIISVEEPYITWRQMTKYGEKLEGAMSIEVYLDYIRDGAYKVLHSWYGESNN